MEPPTAQNALRVLVVERNDPHASRVVTALAFAGYAIVGHVIDARGLYEQACCLQPDVIVLDVRTPDEEMLADIDRVALHAPCPIVMFTANGERSMIEKAVRAGIASYVVDGLADERMRTIIEVATARFEYMQAVKKERDVAHARLAERKLIERAKGLLMRRRGMDEDEAYHTLRRIAMDKKLSMRVVAEQLIDAARLLG